MARVLMVGIVRTVRSQMVRVLIAAMRLTVRSPRVMVVEVQTWKWRQR